MLNRGWEVTEGLDVALAALGADRWTDHFGRYLGETRLPTDWTDATPRGVRPVLKDLAHDGSDLGFAVRVLHLHWKQAAVHRRLSGCFEGFFGVRPEPLATAVQCLSETFALPPHPRRLDLPELRKQREPLAMLKRHLADLCILARAHGAIAAATAPLHGALTQAALAPDLAAGDVATARAALAQAVLDHGAVLGAGAEPLRDLLAMMDGSAAPDPETGGALLLAVGDALADTLHGRLFDSIRDLPLRGLYDALAALGLYGWRAALRDIAVTLHHRAMVEAAWRRMDTLAERYDGLRQIDDPDLAMVSYRHVAEELQREVEDMPPLGATDWWAARDALRDARLAFDRAARAAADGTGAPGAVQDARAILAAQTRAWRVAVAAKVAASARAIDAAARDLAPLGDPLAAFVARVDALIEGQGP